MYIWVVFYYDGSNTAHSTREEAYEYAFKSKKAVSHIECWDKS